MLRKIILYRSLPLTLSVLLLLSNGCSNPTINADFRFSASPSNALDIQFGDASTGPVSTWKWNFGDNTPDDTTTNPTHTYGRPGSYVVELEVTDGGSLRDQKSQRVTVYEAPPADFSFRPDHQDIQTLQFTGPQAQVYGTPLGGAPPALSIHSWVWDLGDGSQLNGPSISHRYGQQGTYNVTLQTTGPGGTTFETQTVVVGNAPPVSDFLATASANDVQHIQFQDQSQGSVNAWAWDFGDGSSSTMQNPDHPYQQGGSYRVALTATGPGGVHTSTQTVNVDHRAPAPILTYQINTSSAPYQVQFTGNAVEAVYSWEWDFGDFNQSTLQNPTHSYQNDGSYTVLLKATGPGGDGDSSEVLNLGITPPTVNFSFQAISSGHYDMEFTPTVTGAIDRLEIFFGDGDDETLVPPNPAAPTFSPLQHSYAAAGTYRVEMKAFGPIGNADVNNAVVVVEPPLSPSFTVQPSTGGPAPLTAQLNGQATGHAQQWQWDFGDGHTGSGQQVSHTFQQQGNYAIVLSVTGPGGTETTTQNLNVGQVQTQASATASPSGGSVPFTVFFDNLSVGNGAMTSSWDFGDGESSTETAPTHTYFQAGNLNATLTVTDAFGLTSSTTVVINAQAVPLHAAINAPRVIGPEPFTVDLTDNSSGTITEWTWEFGDGTPPFTTTDRIQAQQQRHIYNQAGRYTVTLTIKGPRPPPDHEDTAQLEIFATPSGIGLPIARISADPAYGPAPHNVSFTDISTGTYHSVEWDFGDGSSSTNGSPNHTFGNSGDYSVRLSLLGPPPHRHTLGIATTLITVGASPLPGIGPPVPSSTGGVASPPLPRPDPGSGGGRGGSGTGIPGRRAPQSGPGWSQASVLRYEPMAGLQFAEKYKIVRPSGTSASFLRPIDCGGPCQTEACGLTLTGLPQGQGMESLAVATGSPGTTYLAMSEREEVTPAPNRENRLGTHLATLSTGGALSVSRKKTLNANQFLDRLSPPIPTSDPAFRPNQTSFILQDMLVLDGGAVILVGSVKAFYDFGSSSTGADYIIERPGLFAVSPGNGNLLWSLLGKWLEPATAYEALEVRANIVNDRFLVWILQGNAYSASLVDGVLYEGRVPDNGDHLEMREAPALVNDLDLVDYAIGPDESVYVVTRQEAPLACFDETLDSYQLRAFKKDLSMEIMQVAALDLDYNPHAALSIHSFGPLRTERRLMVEKDGTDNVRVILMGSVWPDKKEECSTWKSSPAHPYPAYGEGCPDDIINRFCCDDPAVRLFNPGVCTGVPDEGTCPCRGIKPDQTHCTQTFAPTTVCARPHNPLALEQILLKPDGHSLRSDANRHKVAAVANGSLHSAGSYLHAPTLTSDGQGRVIFGGKLIKLDEPNNPDLTLHNPGGLMSSAVLIDRANTRRSIHSSLGSFRVFKHNASLKDNLEESWAWPQHQGEPLIIPVGNGRLLSLRDGNGVALRLYEPSNQWAGAPFKDHGRTITPITPCLDTAGTCASYEFFAQPHDKNPFTDFSRCRNYETMSDNNCLMRFLDEWDHRRGRSGIRRIPTINSRKIVRGGGGLLPNNISGMMVPSTRRANVDVQLYNVQPRCKQTSETILDSANHCIAHHPTSGRCTAYEMRYKKGYHCDQENEVYNPVFRDTGDPLMGGWHRFFVRNGYKHTCPEVGLPYPVLTLTYDGDRLEVSENTVGNRSTITATLPRPGDVKVEIISGDAELTGGVREIELSGVTGRQPFNVTGKTSPNAMVKVSWRDGVTYYRSEQELALTFDRTGLPCRADSGGFRVCSPRHPGPVLDESDQPARHAPSFVGKNVDLGTKAYWATEVDIETPGIDIPFVVSRHYIPPREPSVSSTDPSFNPREEGAELGPGWRLNLIQWLLPITSDTNPTAIEPSGRGFNMALHADGRVDTFRYPTSGGVTTGPLSGDSRIYLYKAGTGQFEEKRISARVVTYQSPRGYNGTLRGYTLTPPAGGHAGDIHPFYDPQRPEVGLNDERFFILTEYGGQKRVFNCKGQLIRIISAPGHHMEFHYQGPVDRNTGLPVLSGVVDTNGRLSQLHWRMRGSGPKLAEIVLPLGRKIKYQYRTHQLNPSRLASVVRGFDARVGLSTSVNPSPIDPSVRLRHGFGYTSDDLLKFVFVEMDGRQITILKNHYNGEILERQETGAGGGQSAQSIAQDGGLTSIDYTSTGAKVTDAAGTEWTYVLQDIVSSATTGKVIQSSKVKAEVYNNNLAGPAAPLQDLITRFEYDAAGRVTKTDPPGPEFTETKYNSRGDILERIENGGSGRRPWTWNYAYQGPCPLRETVTDPTGAQTVTFYYSFDPALPGQTCRVYRVKHPRVTDPNGTQHNYRTTYTYYGAQQNTTADDRLLRGQVLSSVFGEESGSNSIQERSHKYWVSSGGGASAGPGRTAYTKLGLVSETTTTGDIPAQCTGDVPVQRKIHQDYDHRGNNTSTVEWVADPANPTALPTGGIDTWNESRVYDQADRLYSINQNGAWTHYTYNDRGQVVEIINDARDMFDGSLLSRPVTNTNPWSEVTRILYQHSGAPFATLTGTKQLNRDPDFNSFTFTAYDGLDRPVLLITPAGGISDTTRFRTLSALMNACPPQVPSYNGPTCAMKALADANWMSPQITAQDVKTTGAPFRFENSTYTKDGLVTSQRSHDGTQGLNPDSGGHFSQVFYNEQRLAALSAPGAQGDSGKNVLSRRLYNDFGELKESILYDPDGCKPAAHGYTALRRSLYENRDNMGRPRRIITKGDNGAVSNRQADQLDAGTCDTNTELGRLEFIFDEVGRNKITTRHVHVIDGAGASQSVQFKYTYGPLGNVAAEQVNNKVERSYADYSGAICAESITTAGGQVVKEVDFQLDGQSRVLRQTTRHLDIQNHGLGEPAMTVEFRYDEYGNRHIVRDGLKRETKRRFDALGRLRVEEVFNDVGQAVRLTETRYDDYGNPHFEMTLTNDGRRGVHRSFRDKHLIEETTTLDQEWRSRRKFVLDHEGRPLRIYPHGLDQEVNIREWDSVGRLKKETLSLAGQHIMEKTFSYDAFGNVTRLSAKDLSTPRISAWDETKIYRYNGLGERTLAQNRINDPRSSSSARKGPVSNVWTIRDTLGHVREEGTFFFDRNTQGLDNDHVVRADFNALGKIQSLHYDDDIHRRNRVSLSFSYDDALRLNTITGTAGMLVNRFELKRSGDYVMRRQWFDAGSVAKHTSDYSYDRLLRRYKVEHTLGHKRLESRQWYRNGAVIWNRNVSWRWDTGNNRWIPNADDNLMDYPTQECSNDAGARIQGVASGRAMAEVTGDSCFRNDQTVRVMSAAGWDVVEETGLFGSQFSGIYRDALGREKETLNLSYAGSEDDEAAPSVVRRRIRRVGGRIAQEQKVEIGATISGVFTSSYDWGVRAITDVTHAYEGNPLLAGLQCENRVGAFDTSRLRRLCGTREYRFSQPPLPRFPGAGKPFDAINIAGIWRVSELRRDHLAAVSPTRTSELEASLYKIRFNPLGGPKRISDHETNVDKYDIEYDLFGRQVFVRDNHYLGAATNTSVVTHRFLYDAMDRLIYEDYQGLNLSNDDITYAPTFYGYFGKDLIREYTFHPTQNDPSDRVFVYGAGADLVYTARMGSHWNPNYRPPIGYVVLEDLSNGIMSLYLQHGADRGHHFIQGEIKGSKVRNYIQGASAISGNPRRKEPFKQLGSQMRTSPFDQMTYAMGGGFRRSRTESWRATESVAVQLTQAEWMREAAQHQMVAAGAMLLALPVSFYFSGAALAASAAGGSAFPYIAAGVGLGLSVEAIGAYGLYGKVQDQGWTDENMNEAGWIAFGVASELATLGGGRLLAAAEAAQAAALAYQTPTLVEGAMGMSAALGDNCFAAGTQIWTEEGLKAIEDIEVGENVWSWDEKTDEISLQPVLQTFQRTSDELVMLTVDGKDIETTFGHPVWVEGKGWIFAGKLKKGDKLRTKEGPLLPVTMRPLPEKKEVPVYNIEVAVGQSYFVEKSAFLVHNTSVGQVANINRNVSRLKTLRLRQKQGRRLNQATGRLGAIAGGQVNKIVKRQVTFDQIDDLGVAVWRKQRRQGMPKNVHGPRQLTRERFSIDKVKFKDAERFKSLSPRVLAGIRAMSTRAKTSLMKRTVGRILRGKGGKHEMLPVDVIDHMRKIGVTPDDVLSLTIKTKGLTFVVPGLPPGLHHQSKASSVFHKRLFRVLRKTSTRAEAIEKSVKFHLKHAFIEGGEPLFTPQAMKFIRDNTRLR